MVVIGAAVGPEVAWLYSWSADGTWRCAFVGLRVAEEG